MRENKKYEMEKLRDYALIFSRAEVFKIMNYDFSSINFLIKKHDKRWIKAKKKTYIEYLKHIYKILKNKYPNEYIYKNSLLNEFFISELKSNKNVSFYNEFKVGDNIADMALFNGKSIAYEIKTEFDSKIRLTNQIEQYSKLFNYVYLVIPESKRDYNSLVNENTGLIIFNNNKSNNLEIIKEAKRNYKIDKNLIMEVLHTKEYKEIVKLYYGKLPDITSFNQYKICKQLIKDIPSEVLNQLFIEQVKKRQTKRPLSNYFHKEFNQLMLSLNFTKTEKELLINNLKIPLSV